MNDYEKREVERDVYVSLRDHFTALRQEQDRRIEQALNAAKDAVDKAEKAQERRLDLLNEFRQQSQDEQNRFALKAVIEPRLDRVESRLDWFMGGLFVLGAIGIANLVKLFFG